MRADGQLRNRVLSYATVARLAMIIHSRQRRWTPRQWAHVGAAASLSLSLTWWFSDDGPGGRRAADDGARAAVVAAEEHAAPAPSRELAARTAGQAAVAATAAAQS